MRVFAGAADIRDSGLAELVGDWVHRDLFTMLISDGKPHCGSIDPLVSQVLFAERAEQVASAAVLPLRMGEHHGVLGIGSRNAAHFHASMGTMYLRQLADVLSRLLAPRVK